MDELIVVIAILGLIAIIVVGVIIFTMTRKILRRMDSILIAHMSLTEFRNVKVLIDGIEKKGVKRGNIVLRDDGTWGIAWNPRDSEDVKMNVPPLKNADNPAK